MQEAVSRKTKGSGCLLTTAYCSRFPIRIVKLNRLCIRLYLFANLSGVAHDYGCGVIGSDMVSRYPLNIVRGNRIDLFAVSFQIIVREIVHPDAHELIDQSVLGFNADWEDAGKVRLGVLEFFRCHRLVANPPQLIKELVQGSARYRSPHFG